MVLITGGGCSQANTVPVQSLKISGFCQWICSVNRLNRTRNTM